MNIEVITIITKDDINTAHYISGLLNDKEFQYDANEAISVFGNILNRYYDFDEEEYYIASEGAGYSTENQYPVFILLTMGNNILSNTIVKVTGDQYSHASISFTPYLDPLYTFGEKHGTVKQMTRKFKTTPLGFVKTNPYDYIWYSSDYIKVRYAVYVTFVNKESYDKMQKRLQFFIDNNDSLKYSFKQLITCKLNKPTNDQTKWFCSRFVAEIINAGKPLKRHTSLYRPQNFTNELPETELLYEGENINDYDPQKTIRELERMKYM